MKYGLGLAALACVWAGAAFAVSDGSTAVSGLGTAGTPAGGVLTVQGSLSGTVLPVSVSVAANPTDVMAGPSNFTGAGTLAVNSQGSGSTGIVITGTFTGAAWTVQGTVNGTTWANIPFWDNINGGVVYTQQPTSTSVGTFVAGSSGYSQIRLNVTSISTGTLTASLNSSAGSIQGPIGVQGTNTNITGINGTAPSVTNGMPQSFNTAGSLGVPRICGSHVYKHFTTGPDNQILNSSGSNNIYICDYEISANGAVNVYLEKSSSGTCGSPTQIDMAWYLTTNVGRIGPNTAYRGLSTGASQQLCLNMSASQSVDISVYYDQSP